jgi:hypothetical protein
MPLVAVSKNLIKFDTKTFLSTINGGRKIEVFPKKQTDGYLLDSPCHNA